MKSLNTLFLAIVLLTFSTVTNADTLMVQINVKSHEHSFLKSWVTPRNVAEKPNTPAEHFIRVVAYNNSGGQVIEYFIEDTWQKLRQLPDLAQQDYHAPKSYILRIPHPQDVERVELSRGTLSEMESPEDLEKILIISKSW